MQNTLLAYTVLRADTFVDEQLLQKIRDYFLENRQNGYWRNTYESARIIEAILPDLLKNKGELTKPVMHIEGDTTIKVAEFPFEMQLKPSRKIAVTKTGDFPVYFTSYQRFWNHTPECKKGDFEISTTLDNSVTANLKAGEQTRLVAKVKVLKNAEYVMINIPIPGGCSYLDKKNNYNNESHREYFKNETSIFCDHLPKGEYTFEIDLISRYGGTYTLNPAKIELMYFPVFNANNEMKRIIIK